MLVFRSTIFRYLLLLLLLHLFYANSLVIYLFCVARIHVTMGYDSSKDSEGKRTKFHVIEGAMYELVLEIVGKIGGTYIVPQYYRGTILKLVADFQGQLRPNIQWIIFEKLTKHMIG